MNIEKTTFFWGICLFFSFSFIISGEIIGSPVEIKNGETLFPLSGKNGAWIYYVIDIPVNARDLQIGISGGYGDADLYVRYNSIPDSTGFDCRPYSNGNNETCVDPFPLEGKHYIGISAYGDFSKISLAARLTYEPDPVPEKNTFTVTAVKDNLDNHDLFLMAEGFKSLGYKEVKQDINVSSEDLTDYLSSDITALYHTGHGEKGSIKTATGSISTKNASIRSRHTVFATCLTLSDKGWRKSMSEKAMTISGYTNVSWDITDNDVAESFIGHLKQGRSYPVSWYLANTDISSVADRWCIYSREGGKIVEYSARSHVTPKNAKMDFVPFDESGKLLVEEGIFEKKSPAPVSFRMFKIGKIDEGSIVYGNGFSFLSPTALSKDDSVSYAIHYLSEKGEWGHDMIFDRAIALCARSSDGATDDTVGWMIRFCRTAEDGIMVRGNGRDIHKTVLIGKNGETIAFSKHWPSIKESRSNDSFIGLLTEREALSAAGKEIAARIKQDVLRVVSVLPVYGFSTDCNDLSPGYGYLTDKQFILVIDAKTGRLMR